VKPQRAGKRGDRGLIADEVRPRTTIRGAADVGEQPVLPTRSLVGGLARIEADHDREVISGCSGIGSSALMCGSRRPGHREDRDRRWPAAERPARDGRGGAPRGEVRGERALGIDRQLGRHAQRLNAPDDV
jgi:hypothetical protein